MKCLIINGSPHMGNTWEFVKLFKERIAESELVEFQEIHLSKLDIPFCVGCNNCFIKGEDKCPHSNKIQPIIKRIEECDFLVIASPAYSLNVTAVMKNFIDHMSYVFHRPRFYAKKALVLSTAAGAGAKEASKYIRNVLKFWGFNSVYTFGIACFEASGYKPKEKTKKDFYKTADKFINDIKSDKLHKPTLKRLVYFNIWRATSNLGSPEDNIDNKYWLETGLREAPYFKEIPLKGAKGFLGNMMYKMFNKMFTRF